MIYHMLGFVLSIAWAIIFTLYTIGNIAIISEIVIEHDEAPSNNRIGRFLIGLTSSLILWWLVWVLHFYI